MKCDFCNNKASVFLTQLLEGQMKKVCLCETCAKDQGVTDPTGFSLAEMMLGGIAPKPQQVQAFSASPSGRRCPNCGFSIEDLRKVRRFGCSDCYPTFAEEVGQMLHGMHKGPQHLGKIPGGLVARQVLHRRLEDLRGRLDSAISSESYEEAARLRDEIKSIEHSPQP